LPILKYDANQDKLVEQKGETLDEEEKRTKMEGEKKPKTPLQMALKEGEDLESSNNECYRSNDGISVESQHQEECGSPSFVHHHKHIYN
jgi:hypothetical protein